MPRGYYNPSKVGGTKRRRSVEHDCPTGFVGWEVVLIYHEMAKDLDENDKKGFYEHELYYVTLFETGGRCGEVLLLKPEQVIYNDEAIKINRMEVYKRRKRFTRDFLIKRDPEINPLADRFVELVEKCKTLFLLPAHKRFSREIEPNKHTSKSTVYNRISDIDESIWPHWIRDTRSWHLSASPKDGGLGLDPYELRDWFKWESIEMAAHYAGKRREEEMAKAMGIKEIPE